MAGIVAPELVEGEVVALEMVEAGEVVQELVGVGAQGTAVADRQDVGQVAGHPDQVAMLVGVEPVAALVAPAVFWGQPGEWI